MLTSVRMERLYRFLGDPVVVGTGGWLDPESDSGEASVRGPQMDMSHDQSSM